MFSNIETARDIIGTLADREDQVEVVIRCHRAERLLILLKRLALVEEARRKGEEDVAFQEFDYSDGAEKTVFHQFSLTDPNIGRLKKFSNVLFLQVITKSVQVRTVEGEGAVEVEVNRSFDELGKTLAVDVFEKAGLPKDGLFKEDPTL